jgi:hypothetical protein
LREEQVLLEFSERSGDALQLVLDVASCPASGIRISGRLRSKGTYRGIPFLELAAVAEVKTEDEWLISPCGIPVFVAQDVAEFLRGMVLDASTTDEGTPQFVVRRDEPAMG